MRLCEHVHSMDDSPFGLKRLMNTACHLSRVGDAASDCDDYAAPGLIIHQDGSHHAPF
ncbi:MAG: hypothetical protein K2M27_05215 [Muribaculaceae bacterium]|nr:hypothetical protein [Muribaculaceae bacterium]